MLACIDVDYRDHDTIAVAACVLFRDWRDGHPADEKTVLVTSVEAYVPGEFWRRELPCILRLLDDVDSPLEAILIDGYVWLDGAGRPGLGGRLFEAMGRKVPVIGVAKNAFTGATLAVEVRRGTSTKPLYVTAAGVDVHEAAACVESMHRPFRIPTLIRRADQRCRAHRAPES